MKLVTKTYGSPENPPLILLHGLFGSGKLWRAFAEQFSTDFWVHTPDSRNHGQSPHHDSMTLEDMADDLYEYMDEHNIAQSHILGHSMGGKTAMQFALDYPERVSRMIIEDIAPVLYKPRHNDLFEGVRVINSTTLKNRTHAEKLTRDIIKDTLMRQFLFTNLSKNEQGELTWFVNMEGIENNYPHISKPPQGNYSAFTGPVMFIRGGQSPYVLDEHRARIKQLFPLSRINTVKEAGHFLHNQDGDSFMRICWHFLRKPS